ncbi:hypothetical protein INS49_013256 [Diaporthe citri]|uniref:uncharacterized protein n=1 Tax=Diaporthe citri TaxID=83186 RepID=UPI001C806D54|nr:uncharacterized protein INS49_013256 [Diaporthe citri]KAG6357379.1 hypothetical protein INS49_013256 [Diaporthe citri]
MKAPSIVTTITYAFAFSGLALAVPTVGHGIKARSTNTDWMLKCTHGSCYSVVGCTMDGAVTHNNPSCWQMCTCVAYNSTIVTPVR